MAKLATDAGAGTPRLVPIESLLDAGFEQQRRASFQ
jgi:hypothetical protein